MLKAIPRGDPLYPRRTPQPLDRHLVGPGPPQHPWKRHSRWTCKEGVFGRPDATGLCKWARQHKRLLRKIETKPEELTVYTDGSLSHDQGVWRTGAGIVAFCRGKALFQHRIALGEFAEVYDAEMEGLASGAEAVLEWLAQTGPRHGIQQIRFFADNTGALQRIYKGTPGLDQDRSLRFRRATHHILDTNPELKIDITWVPGHHDVPGNELADRLAKRGSTDASMQPGYQSAAFARNTSRRDLRDRWRKAWEANSNHHGRSDFRIANQMQPSTTPLKRLLQLDRKTFSRVFQCRTGHAHIGSYYDYFEIQEPKSCACGATFQTRKHILLECTTHNEHRHILADDNGNIQLGDILGSVKGIERLARFITATGAYNKPPDQ